MQKGPLAVEIASMTQADLSDWVALRARLWPHAAESEHRSEALEFCGRADFAAWIVRQQGEAIGFAEVSIRPFANGCESRPVAFLEGIWISEEARGQGIARKLIEVIEDWARQKGFRELGSDAELSNLESQRRHAQWGFSETERVVYFRKKL